MPIVVPCLSFFDLSLLQSTIDAAFLSTRLWCIILDELDFLSVAHVVAVPILIEVFVQALRC